ncbi:MAG: M1 family metallopeptidase [Chitinophagales bacterium]
MKRSLYLIGFLAVFCLGACAQKKQGDADLKEKNMYPNDPHSYAHPNEMVVQHLQLNLLVDFETKKFTGTATWDIKRSGKAETLILDTRNLDIQKVVVLHGDTESETAFTIGASDPVLGSALEIKVPADVNTVRIYYNTTAGADALQWLDPAQTSGKQYPFLFTQSQAILARTWIPCQDGPGVRFSYDAHIEVPAQFMAVMSAENPQQKSADGKYDFHMAIPIPSYLMALAVGDISFHALGRNTGVYAENNMLDKCIWEFADMQQMMDTAEKLYGKYAWGRYDVIVLPPSFPFGGMENPMLTFATPTIISGDRSLVALVAHELAHSWSGNLVTNATWDDFWLNEGFTVYFENRIMEAIYGKEYGDMLEVLGYEDLKATVADMGADSADTHLKLDLKGRDPDDGMNDIAYEKGNLFLKTMEIAVGRDTFDAFLNKWFHDNAFQSRNTEEFIDFLNANLISKHPDEMSAIDVHAWIYEAGIPENHAVIVSERFEHVDAIAKTFNANGTIQADSTTDWSTHEWLRFLQQMPENISLDRLNTLDGTFHLTQTGNAEIADVWFELCIRAHYDKAFPAMDNFLCSVGRRKVLTPLYKAMLQSGYGDKARDIYSRARPGYHAVAQGTMDELLAVKK